MAENTGNSGLGAFVLAVGVGAASAQEPPVAPAAPTVADCQTTLTVVMDSLRGPNLKLYKDLQSAGPAEVALDGGRCSAVFNQKSGASDRGVNNATVTFPVSGTGRLAAEVGYTNSQESQGFGYNMAPNSRGKYSLTNPVWTLGPKK